MNDQGTGAGRGLPRAREDLLVIRDSDDPTKEAAYLLKKPESGELFRLVAQDWFLFTAGTRFKSMAAVLAEFEQRFGCQVTAEDYSAFLNELRDLGLLAEESPAPASAPDREQPTVPLEPDRRASAPATRPAARRRTEGPARWRLFDPDPMLGGLAWLLRPFRHAVWLVFPALILAGLVHIQNHQALVDDLEVAADGLSLVVYLLVSLLTVNFASKVFQGVVCRGFGGRVRSFGIRLILGIIPRFYVDGKEIRRLPTKGQVWSYSAPLLVKLSLYVIGVLVWWWTRTSGTHLSEAALVLGCMGLGAFVFTANPLWPADGYNLTALLLGDPKLRSHAWTLLRLKLTLRPLPPDLSGRRAWGLLLYGVASVVFTAALFGVVGWIAAEALEERFAGLGVVIFALLVLISLWWIWASARRRRAAARAVPRDPDRWRARLVMLAVLGGLVAVGLLPYRYEVTGSVVLLPARSMEVRATVAGTITEIVVQEGEWVEQGAVLARMAGWEEQHEMAAAQAALEKAQAELALLREGASEEEINRYRQAVESARVDVRFAEQTLERQRTLYSQGVVPAATFEAAQNRQQAALAELAEAEAALADVSSPPRQAEIKAAAAEVRKLNQVFERSRETLGRTVLTAPGPGRIVTPRLGQRDGLHLGVGDLFCTIENTRVLLAEIEVPEYEIELIKSDAPVRIRLWGVETETFDSTLIMISPAAEERDIGTVVRTVARLPNPDGRLQTRMTGYAKVDVGQMTVAEAFTRMLVRFFRVEVWSWIP